MLNFMTLATKIIDFVSKTKQKNNLDHNTALELERLDKAARELIVRFPFPMKPRSNNTNDEILKRTLLGNTLKGDSIYDNTLRSENYEILSMKFPATLLSLKSMVWVFIS